MILTRTKARRRQFDINVEAALTNKQTVSAGTVDAQGGTSGGTTGVVLGSVGGGGFGGGGGGGDGMYRCFAGGTMVALANGQERAIALVEVGKEYVFVPQPDGSVRPAQVLHKSVSVAMEWMEIGTGGKITLVKPRHFFRSVSGQWEMIQDLDVVVQRDKEGRWDKAELVHKELVVGPQRSFYTLLVDDPAHAFIADGYWVKNAKLPEGDDGPLVI